MMNENTAKINLISVAFANAEKEKAFATMSLKARKLLASAQENEEARLAKRHEEFTGRPVFDSDKKRITQIASENLKTKKSNVMKIVRKLAPKYYDESLKNLYIAYVDAMSNTEAFESLKRSLQNTLNDDYNIYYSLKTCEAILAMIGATRANVSERSNGLLIKARSQEDFARMLMNALYQQFSKEGLKLAQDKKAEILYSIDTEAQKACNDALKALANFAD